MQIERGMIVRSNAGHDSGGFFVVLSLEEGAALIADGKLRTLSHPKRKNKKHLSPTKEIVCVDALKTDRQIRHVLWEYNYGQQNPTPENQGG